MAYFFSFIYFGGVTGKGKKLENAYKKNLAFPYSRNKLSF